MSLLRERLAAGAMGVFIGFVLGFWLGGGFSAVPH